MNQITKQKNRHELTNLFETSSKVGNHEGCLKVFNNSLEHEQVKFEIFYKLKKQGFEEEKK